MSSLKGKDLKSISDESILRVILATLHPTALEALGISIPESLDPNMLSSFELDLSTNSLVNTDIGYHVHLLKDPKTNRYRISGDNFLLNQFGLPEPIYHFPEIKGQFPRYAIRSSVLMSSDCITLLKCLVTKFLPNYHPIMALLKDHVAEINEQQIESIKVYQELLYDLSIHLDISGVTEPIRRYEVPDVLSFSVSSDLESVVGIEIPRLSRVQAKELFSVIDSFELA